MSLPEDELFERNEVFENRLGTSRISIVIGTEVNCSQLNERTSLRATLINESNRNHLNESSS